MGKHLFVDDEEIHQTFGTWRVLNQPTKLPGPLITSGEPGRGVAAWGNAIREEDGRLRLWYLSYLTKGHDMGRAGVWGRGTEYGFFPQGMPGECPITHHSLGMYAESTDGLTWEKPNLGLYEHRGTRDNNIFLTGEAASRQFDGCVTNWDGHTIVRDEAEEDPERRYKMVAHWETSHVWDNRVHLLDRPGEDMERFWAHRAKYITCSPDGIHWNQPLERFKGCEGGDRMILMRDHRNRRWMLFDRPLTEPIPGIGYTRFLGLSYSEDLVEFTSPNEVVLTPDELDGHGELMQFESFIPFNYGNQDLAFLFASSLRTGGLSSTYLLSHRDGGPWKRVFRDQPFIPVGAPGAHDRCSVVPLHNEPIVVGDRMYIYYDCSRTEEQHSDGVRCIAGAHLRLDGFVGMASRNLRGRGPDGTDASAWIITRPVRVEGPELTVNLEVVEEWAERECVVELRRPDWTPIEGYRYEDCVSVMENSVAAPVRWKNRDNVAGLVGEEVVVCIRYSHAVLYSYRFGD